MDNLFYDLLVRIAALISANAGVIAKGATVQVGRIQTVMETSIPFVGVYLTGDAAAGEFGPQNTNFMDWDVAVAVEILVDADATTDNLEQDYLNLRADIHNAIMTDAPTLSLGFVQQAYPIGANEPILSDEGKRKTASYRTEWLFRVRTSLADMTV